MAEVANALSSKFVRDLIALDGMPKGIFELTIHMKVNEPIEVVARFYIEPGGDIDVSRMHVVEIDPEPEDNKGESM